MLGIGAGGPLAEIAGFGGARRTAGESVSALEDGLRLIRHAWDSATHDGHYYQLGVQFGPVPAQPVPISVGAFGSRMLALTGRLADGWLPTNAYLDLDDVPARQRQVDAAAERAGRDPDGIRRVFNVLGMITDARPPENGRRLVGPPRAWVDALTDYRDRLGFDSFVFWPVGGDRVAQTTTFLEEVRPALNSP